ncbi:hypothetical protein RchiOBHm_Chr2g0171241 [Rosa chinensis]|uniref:Uncharacterized protein n=1 Tax=Rosa chinensis TaxID=74649 RepID=A0A2P6S5B6_ROSCH|nr:hypothetical protein RchiOBHm_Chr2g0171241 [Rosa chinensis]
MTALKLLSRKLNLLMDLCRLSMIVHVKLNCGSVWYKPSCKVALCVIAPAPDRKVLFAECEIGVATSVPDGEAKACLLALRLAAERLRVPFVIESDFFHAGFSTFKAFGALLPPYVALLISQYQQLNVEWSKCERR